MDKKTFHRKGATHSSLVLLKKEELKHVSFLCLPNNYLGDGMGKAKQLSDFQNPCQDEKLKKNDVLNSVRITEALDNENEPGWKEVKQMKDILSKSMFGVKGQFSDLTSTACTNFELCKCTQIGNDASLWLHICSVR